LTPRFAIGPKEKIRSATEAPDRPRVAAREALVRGEDDAMMNVAASAVLRLEQSDADVVGDECVGEPPFRAPHHKISPSGLVVGGRRAAARCHHRSAARDVECP
jgi:hypothetical protein